jgi:Family of unknown function (DUF6283)
VGKKQCKACPWRKDVNPQTDIPNGYCEAKHKNLKATIAQGAASLGKAPNMMACHESAVGSEEICVGWAMNQLGPGNNIGLRLRAIKDTRFHGLETVGPQHQRFEDTLP